MVQADADMAGQHALEGRLSIYPHWRKPEDMNPLRLRTIAHFFEHYKDLEEGKWVKILGWEGPDAARKEIMDGVAAYQFGLGRTG